MHTSFKLSLAGAAVLAVAGAPSAQAQEGGIATTVLDGVLDGFTGSAGEELWGWMLGGGQSAGLDAISSELDSINSTLTAMENELATIVDEIAELGCEFSSVVIEGDDATAIDTWYGDYQDYLSDMAAGASVSVSTLQSWSNDVINGTASDQSVLSAMTGLKDLATDGAGANGSIYDCVNAAGTGNLYETNGIDDRPYYDAYVVPMQNWYLNYNSRAMLMISEAYHFNEWVALDQPASGTAAEIPATICPTGTTSFNCTQPASIYANQLRPYLEEELQAGGAPYSTDEYLMVLGQDYLIARSIEQYNVAADPDNSLGCSTTDPGGLTSHPGDVCGATVGLYSDSFTSVAFGPYDYGADDYGAWVAAPNVGTFGTTLQVEYNQSSTPAATFVPNYLCTMSLDPDAGDMSTCTQASATGALANGGAGLFFGQKIVVFPNRETNGFINSNLNGVPQIVFLDAGIERGTNEQPNTAGPWYLFQGDTCWDFPEWANEEIDPAWYAGEICDVGWTIIPGYGVNLDPVTGTLTTGNYPQYRWPALDWTGLTCSSGTPSDNLNPAGVPSLCGFDFDTWFNAIVPPPVDATPKGLIAGTNGPNGDSCWPQQNLSVLAIGNYTLFWQGDGNLVLYDGAQISSNAVWATGTTTGGTGQQLCWGLDGNLVIYSAAGAAIWASDTADAEHGGNGGAQLQLYNDGTLDIVNADGTVLWYGYRPNPQTTTADATVSSSDPNANDGAGTQLALAGSQPAPAATPVALAATQSRPDRRRALVAFDPAAIEAFLDAGPLASARLVLTSADQSGSGGGHWVAARPLRAGFVEGNGNAAEGDRGTGRGVTWNCAEDFEIADFFKECVEDWPRPIFGGRGEVVFQEDGYTGPVSWDVTADVERGATAWLIARRHGRGRSLAYHSREGAAALGNPSLAPTLILTYADENEVLAEAGAALDAADGPEAGAD